MSAFNRRETLAGAGALIGASLLASNASAATETVEIDLNTVTGPLDHIWSKCAGSDRASITLRESWRRDLERFRGETGLERVRFHGIFSDDLGVWTNGAEPNFQNVDAVYDGLIDRGVAPFVELSFMPRQLQRAENRLRFYVNANPPASVDAWGDFIKLFARHLIDRYGAARVRSWFFEVWNEPNLGFFWTGTQADYFALYSATAKALKSVDPALKVGGPATSSVQWIPQFLDFCATDNAPVDFVTSHVYAGDPQRLLFGEGAPPRALNDIIPAAVAQARAQIDASRFPHLPFWLDEWSSDSPAMIAHTITHCLPHCQAIAQWEISGTFEEITTPNYVLKEGNNGWGMLAQRNIAKPAFNTYKLMHRLGDRHLASTGPALAARGAQGAAALVWNLAEVIQPAGLPDATTTRTVNGERKALAVNFRGARRGQNVRISYVDQDRGSPYPAWRALGSPKYPTEPQLQRIRAAAELGAPETRRLPDSGPLMIDLPPEGVALIELV